MGTDAEDFFYRNFDLVVKNIRPKNIIEEEYSRGYVTQYLQICESLKFMLDEGKKENKFSSRYNSDADLAVEHIENIIQVSLNGIGYKMVRDRQDRPVAQLIDPAAEAIAAESPKNVGDAISDYLCQKPADKNGKKTALEHLIDALEKDLSRFETQANVGATKKYAQAMRHPEKYKDFPEFKWFFDEADYINNLDSLFEMCVFVASYPIAHRNIDIFKKKFNESPKKE
jgi:hypothetical protein